MQVIVIAGGRGSRYKSHEPKLLQVIAGKVLLDHYLDEIYKINDGMSNIEILFLLGKKGNEIIEYLKKIESKYSGAFQFRIEHQQLGTGGAMIQNMDLIQKECIVLLGDLYFDFNFKTFVEFAKARKARIVGVVHPNNHMHDSDKIELEPSTNQIMRIVPKSSFVKQLHANLTFAGIFYFNDFNQLKFNATGEAIDLVEVINLNLETLSCEIYGYVTLEYIKDSGTLERKREIERHIEAGTPVRRSSNKEKSVIFLDRDDTLIKDLDSDYQICESIRDEILLCNNLGIPIVVISNQPSVAKGINNIKSVLRQNAIIDMRLADKGSYIDAWYWCPHHPEGGFPGETRVFKVNCDCRKPSDSLFKFASQDHKINLRESFMIGDSLVDLESTQKLRIEFLHTQEFKYCNISAKHLCFKETHEAFKYAREMIMTK